MIKINTCKNKCWDTFSYVSVKRKIDVPCDAVTYIQVALSSSMSNVKLVPFSSVIGPVGERLIFLFIVQVPCLSVLCAATLRQFYTKHSFFVQLN